MAMSSSVNQSFALPEQGKNSESAPRFNQENQNADEHDPILKLMYIVTCYLCINMFSWIMFAPASWLIGRSSFHREVVLPFLASIGGFRVVPEEIVTKYQGHSLIHFTHIVPGAIWAAVIPFQLHQKWRMKHRKLHRIFGYLFLAASLLMAVGIFVIVQRELTFDHFFPDLPPSKVLILPNPLLLSLALWFAGTAIHSVRMARAGRYKSHQKWVVRHVASGLWVAGQRFLAIPFCTSVTRLTHPAPDEFPRWLQRAIFAGTGIAAILSFLSLGELAVGRISNRTNFPTVSCKRH